MAVEVCIRNSDHGLDGPSNYLGQVVRLVASYSVTMSEFTTVALISLREAKYLTQTNKQTRQICLSVISGERYTRTSSYDEPKFPFDGAVALLKATGGIMRDVALITTSATKRN